jgi:fluoride exporter
MNPIAAMNLSAILLVAAGGALGCVSRFLVVKQVIRLNPTLFPLGTMVVNILGSLLIGIALAKFGPVQNARVFFVTGMLGGFTTFSAFSWDAWQLLVKGQFALAALYILGSVAISIACVAIGWHIVR